jgi:hypothetical protein
VQGTLKRLLGPRWAQRMQAQHAVDLAGKVVLSMEEYLQRQAANQVPQE